MRTGNVAAVDCGTLSTRLAVAGPDGATLARLSQITHLGQGVDAAGCLAAAATQRALAALQQFRQVMDRWDVVSARMVGTSALRDASNRADFTEPARQVVGVALELLSGPEEAALSLTGALSDLGPGPWLMVDIGGGSTELAAGPLPDASPRAAISLDVGCTRLSERFLHHDPPRRSELDAARDWLEGHLGQADQAAPGLREGRALVGLAGTVSALACWAQGLPAYDRDRVHHFELSRAVVARALAQMSALSTAERATLAGVEPARAPMIVGGTLVLDQVMAHFGFEVCTVSEADILDGLVLSQLSSRRS